MQKWLKAILIFGLLLLGVVVFFYWAIWGGNVSTSTDNVVIINRNDTYEKVKSKLVEQNIINNTHTLDITAKAMKFTDASIKPGRYVIDGISTNRQLLHKLRLGEQDPIDLVILNARTLEELAGRVAAQIELDSTTLLNHLHSDQLHNSWNVEPQNVIGKILPDTYKVFWNISEADLTKRLHKEYSVFWNIDRKTQAAKLNLTPEEVTVLASIVQKETNLTSEMPRIAGVYLNRLDRGILLQADPTVVFATGKYDLKRVLNRHLEYDSPYNTYKYVGLPPGPICLPSKPAINAVLQAEKHNYLYFCAKPDYSGSHNFAKTLRQHNNNANIYRAWLNKEGIR